MTSSSSFFSSSVCLCDAIFIAIHRLSTASNAQSSARSDTLELKHWVKTRVARAGAPRVVSDWKEVNGDYAFAKYNKKVPMVMYNDEEYTSMLSDDPQWSREETNHLISMCERFDLRFVIIADRYEWQGRRRSVEELKARYYLCARRLLEAREGIEEAHKKYIEVRQPFDPKHEEQRKAALDYLLTRTPAQEIEDQKILDAAKEIESRRTVEAAAVVSAVNEGARNGDGAGAGGSGGNGGALPDSLTTVQDILPAVDGNGPAAPGIYLRGAHAKARIDAMVDRIPGGARTAELLDKAIAGLGVSDLGIPTHTVCELFVELRREAAAMMELQKKVAMKEQELAFLQGRGIRFSLDGAPRDGDNQMGVKVEAAQAGGEMHASVPTMMPTTDAVVHHDRGVDDLATVEDGGVATMAAGAPGSSALGALETPSSSGRVGREKKRKAPARYQNSPSPPRERGVDRKRK